MNIIVIQLINYTLSFLMWMIVGRAILAMIIGSRRNVMLLAFVKVTEPIYNLTRKILPFLKGPWVPVASLFLLAAARLALILISHPSSGR